MKYEVNDFHIHTRYSACCPEKETTTPENVIARADEMGYECIGITDHIFSPKDVEVIEKVRSEVEQVKGRFKVKVLVSAEVDMMPDGEVIIDREQARRLDYVLVAASHFHILGKDNPSNYTPRQAADILLEYFRRAVESGLCDIIAHPLLNLYNALGNLDEIVETIDDGEIIKVLELAKRNNVAVDMNLGLFSEAKYNLVWSGKMTIEEALVNTEIGPPNRWWHADTQVRFYKLCKEAGVKISPTSDTHTISGIGLTRLLKPWIEKIGFDDDDFVDYDWLMVNRHR